VGKGKGRRIRTHTYNALKGSHRNRYLQNKLRRISDLGLKIVAEKIFEHDDEFPCQLVEITAIEFYGRKNLCNITDGGEGAAGYKHTNDHLARMSARFSGEKNPMYGRKYSAEERAKFASMSGIPWSAAMRASQEAVRLTPEYRAKMVHPGPWKGKKMPPEACAKISAKLTGQRGEKSRRWGKEHSSETRRKMVEAWIKRRARMALKKEAACGH
jgi:NUMOD3 motif